MAIWPLEDRQERLLGRLDFACGVDQVIVDDRLVLMDRDAGVLADHEVLGPEGVRRRLVRAEVLNGHHVGRDLGRCRNVLQRHHCWHVLGSASDRRLSPTGPTYEQGPSECHDGKENTEDQEDAVALRLNLRRQSTHLLIFWRLAPRRA